MLEITLCKAYTGISSYISIDGTDKIKTTMSKEDTKYIVTKNEYFKNNNKFFNKGYFYNINIIINK